MSFFSSLVSAPKSCKKLEEKPAQDSLTAERNVEKQTDETAREARPVGIEGESNITAPSRFV